MSLHSGLGGGESEEAKLDVRRGKGRRRPLEWRKHFLIPEAATHGCPDRRPPPAATQLSSQVQEGPGCFTRSPQPGLSPQSSAPAG